jgi:NADH-quinone oxidoreductase subunit J
VSILLAIAMALTALSSVGVVLARQTIYSALSLVLTVGLLAVIFLLLNAQFLFAVQVIIYAGAVMVLFIFIIALLNPEAEDRPVLDLRAIVGLAGVAATTILVFVAARNGVAASGLRLHGQQIGAASDPYHTFAFPVQAVNAAGNVQTVAGQLFTTFLLPFEITSLLLLVAAIGAVYLTRRTAR